MAITLQPFVQFTSFNFWLVCLAAISHFRVVGVAQTPINHHNTAAASFWHLCIVHMPEISQIRPGTLRMWCATLASMVGWTGQIWSSIKIR